VKKLDTSTIIGGVLTIVVALLIVDWFKRRGSESGSVRDELDLITTSSSVTDTPAVPAISNQGTPPAPRVRS
jgi:hypothetical protein